MRSKRLCIGLGAALLAAILAWLAIGPELPKATTADTAPKASDRSTGDSRRDERIDNHGPRPVNRLPAPRIERRSTNERSESIARRLANSIDAMELEEIQRELGAWTGIDEEWLKRDGIDPRAFAKRVAEIAGSGFSLDPVSKSARYDRSETSSDDARDVAVLTFSSSLDETHGSLAATRQFATSDVTVRAHVPSDAIAEPYRPLLVRWIDVAGARIELMQAERLAPDAGAGTRSFAMRRPEGWTLGRREIEVYALEDGLPKIAAGSFDVVPAEALAWLDATSSIEIRETGDGADGPYLDAIRPDNGAVRIGVRSIADLTGATLRLIPSTRPMDAIELELGIESNPDASIGAWWSATFTDALVPGIWEARVERFGNLVERMSFRSLAR